MVKGFKMCCISNAVDGTDDDVLWNGSGWVGDVRGERERKMKVLTVKMETYLNDQLLKAILDMQCVIILL